MKCESLNSKTDMHSGRTVGANLWQEWPLLSTNVVDIKLNGGVTTSQYGFLSFTSRGSYDHVLSIIGKYDDHQLDAWEQSMGFTSAFTVYSDPNKYNVHPGNNLNSLFEDEFLLRFLDKNGMVQIGNQIFNVQVNNFRLMAINQNSFPYFQNAFIKGEFIPNVMNQFNINEDIDVFDVLDTGVTGINFRIKDYADDPPPPSSSSGSIRTKADRFTGTGKPGTPWDPRRVETIFTNKESFNYDLLGDDGQTYRAQVKASYQTALLYFSLMTEMKYMRRYPSHAFWDNMFTSICFIVGPTVSIAFKSYCDYKKMGDSTLHIPTVPHQNDPGMKHGVDKLNWRPYEGSRRLYSYTMDVMYAFINYADSPPVNTKAVQVKITKS
jgi:hypothetical protein